VNDARLYSAAAARNRDPILRVLRRWLPTRGFVLEVASGSGEHVVHLARGMRGLVFQPSDPRAEARASIDAWVAEAGLDNVRSAIDLDVTGDTWPRTAPDAVICINMVHIAPWEATLGLIRASARLLRPEGILYLYGPFRRGGQHTAPSNATFDADLRQRNPAWGVRDLEAVTEAAARRGLALAAAEEMPANNLSLVFRRASPVS
jgi:SAM-dependent methyltransferase